MMPAQKRLVPQKPLCIDEVNHIAISTMRFALSWGQVVELPGLQMRRKMRMKSRMNWILGTGITVSSMTYSMPAMVIISQ